jgi:hypothetical protein
MIEINYTIDEGVHSLSANNTRTGVWVKIERGRFEKYQGRWILTGAIFTCHDSLSDWLLGFMHKGATLRDPKPPVFSTAFFVELLGG